MREGEHVSFIVKIRSFQGFAEYRETNHIAVVPVAPVVGQALVQISKDSVIKWNPPYENEIISEEKRAEIIQNVAEAMRFREYPVEIV